MLTPMNRAGGLPANCPDRMGAQPCFLETEEALLLTKGPGSFIIYSDRNRIACLKNLTCKWLSVS
jgi:hypothetical protein